MRTVLLLGAGFSANWGGWLAKEVIDFLLGCPEILNDRELREVVWGHSDSGFESALSQLQAEAIADPTSELKQRRLDAMQDAVVRLFDMMNESFYSELNFEPHNNRTGTIREFLSRFDAIFTLNQDLLLEYHYHDTFDISLAQSRRWDGVQLPGMHRIPSQDPMSHTSWARSWWKPLPNMEYRIEPRCQPYIKLHGSCNWTSINGRRLLVMGGNKENEIQQHSILSRYALEFSNYLCRPETRLMVIGYGFRDHHINKVVRDAVYDHGLQTFIIAPEGRDLAKVFKSKSQDVPDVDLMMYGYDLAEIFRRSLIGASQRRLRDTFGRDLAERQKLLRFFDG